MNPRLQAIAAKAGANVTSLIHDADEEILASWDAAVQEAKETETHPKFKLGVSITFDLDANRMETKLTFGIKHTFPCDDPIPDPEQLPLPIEGQ